MQTYDIIMLVVLAAAIAFGAWKGLAWQVASLCAIFVSYFVALQFRQNVAEYIDAPNPWNVFLAMLILYLATSALIWIAFRLIKGFIDKVKLKDFDSHAGALLGAAKGVVMCVIITLFAMTLLSEQQRESIYHSHSGHYIALLLNQAHNVMPEEIHEVLHPYIHELENHNLDGHQHSEHEQPSEGITERSEETDILTESDLQRSAEALRDATDAAARLLRTQR